MDFKVKSLHNMKMTIVLGRSSPHKNATETKSKKSKRKREKNNYMLDCPHDSTMPVTASDAYHHSDAVPQNSPSVSHPQVSVKTEPIWDEDILKSAKISYCMVNLSHSLTGLENDSADILDFPPRLTQMKRTIKEEPDKESNSVSAEMPDSKGPLSGIIGTSAMVQNSEDQEREITSNTVGDSVPQWDNLAGETLPVVKTEPELGFKSEQVKSESHQESMFQSQTQDLPTNSALGTAKPKAKSNPKMSTTESSTSSSFDSGQNRTKANRKTRNGIKSHVPPVPTEEGSLVRAIEEVTPADEMKVSDEFVVEIDIAVDAFEDCVENEVPLPDQLSVCRNSAQPVKSFFKGCPNSAPVKTELSQLDYSAHTPDLGACEPDFSASEPDFSARNEEDESDADWEAAQEEEETQSEQEEEAEEEEDVDLPVTFGPLPATEEKQSHVHCAGTQGMDMSMSASSTNPQETPQNSAAWRHICGVCGMGFGSDVLSCVRHVETQHMQNFSHGHFSKPVQDPKSQITSYLRQDPANNSQSFESSSVPVSQKPPEAAKNIQQSVAEVKTEDVPYTPLTALNNTPLKGTMNRMQKMCSPNSEQSKLIQITPIMPNELTVSSMQIKPGAGKELGSVTQTKRSFSRGSQMKSFVDNTNTEPSTNSKPKRKKFTCSHCGKTFLDNLQYVNHVRTVHSETDLYSCTTCQQFFANVEEHLKSGRSTHQVQKVKNFCTQCGQSFSNINVFRSHMRIHSENKVLKCSDCDKVFTHGYSLALHQKNHRIRKDHKCEICGKSFQRPEYLRFHLRKHTGERPYTCNVCQKTFSNSSNLAAHYRTHTGEKPYQCGICLAAFTTSSALTVHKWHHTDTKPFQCETCQKEFATANAYKRHKMMHTGQKDFPCKDCGKAFTQSSSLKIHRRIHTGERPFFCTQCRATFTQSAHLTVHVRQHTGEKPFICKDCGLAFPRSEYLLKHSRREHGAPAAEKASR